MGDDEDTALEGLDGLDERGERLSVQEVGWLVENDDVGSSPGGSGENDLHLLTTGETTHRVVRSELSLEAKIFEVVLDFLSNQGTVHSCNDVEDKKMVSVGLSYGYDHFEPSSR